MRKEVTQEKRSMAKSLIGTGQENTKEWGEKNFKIVFLAIVCQYNTILGFFQKYLLFLPMISILRILSF